MNEKEDLEREYQRVSQWINNIDTKISFAIAIVGILLGFVLSNEDLAKTIKEQVKKIELWNSSASLLFFLGLTIALLLIAMWFFLNGLTARINSKKYKQPQMVIPSNIFWGDIAKKSFYSYNYIFENTTLKSWEKDIKTQIYINSCICNKKSRFYNIGLFCLKLSLIFFVLYYICLWFYV